MMPPSTVKLSITSVNQHVDSKNQRAGLYSLRQDNTAGQWWRMPLIPALGRQRQGISEFEASLVYRVSYRTARATQRNPVWKKKKKKKKIIHTSSSSSSGCPFQFPFLVSVKLSSDAPALPINSSLRCPSMSYFYLDPR